MQVKLFPNTSLKIKAEPVTMEEICGDWFRPIVSDMFMTMYREGGVGLAAPQVGIPKRIVVCNDSGRNMHNSRGLFLINPEIVHIGGKQIDWEGCLSIPGISIPIERTDRISVKTLTLSGEIKTFEATGFLSKIIQHEVDHLDGILFIERASKEIMETYGLSIKCFEKRVKEMRQRAAWQKKRKADKARRKALVKIRNKKKKDAKNG